MRELRSDAGGVFGGSRKALEALMGYLLGLQCLRTGCSRGAEGGSLLHCCVRGGLLGSGGSNHKTRPKWLRNGSMQTEGMEG